MPIAAPHQFWLNGFEAVFLFLFKKKKKKKVDGRNDERRTDGIDRRRMTVLL